MWSEITGRLKEQLKANVTFADNLRPALKLASEQLELLSPAVMGMTARGFVADLATHIPRGTWLVVLANPRKVITLQMREGPGATRLDMLKECVAHALDMNDGKKPDHPGSILHLIDVAVNRFGGKPGKKSPAMPPEAVAGLLGMLCCMHDLEKLADALEKVMEENVCPLHVGLVGKGSTEGTICGVWPLAMPFVPYVEGLFPEQTA